MKYNGKNFDEVIEEHNLWIGTGKTKGSYADFSYCDCRDLIFRNLDLSGANFKCAKLEYSLFDVVHMHDTTFAFAKFKRVVFRHSMINYCSFLRASLVGAAFLGTIVYACDFEDSCLSGARFRSMADVYLCNFSNANMDDIDVCTISFDNNTGITADKRIKKISACPDTGAFIGWKKAFVYPDDDRDNYAIVKLEIPEEAKRSSAFGRKCRASEAKVLGIWPIKNDKPDFEHPIDIAYSLHDPGFVYATGKTVTPILTYDDNPYNECASGIHFFITQQEALDY